MHFNSEFKRAALVVALGLVAMGGGVLAQARSDIGVGLILGEPTGVTALFEVNDVNEVDVGIGGSTYRSVSVWGDFLWTQPKVFGTQSEFQRGLVGYFGPGMFFDRLGALGMGLGLRGLFGVRWSIPASAFKLHFEMAPAISLLPAATFGFQAGLGGRFHF